MMRAASIEAIHSNPYTLRLARIPNLLTMMALIHRERARLPHGRALLYTDIATAYLQSIDEHRRIERLGYSLRDQKQWLGRIGFEMQLRRHRSVEQSEEHDEKEILVDGRDVRRWVVSAMCDAGRTDCNEEAADAFLDEICRRSGLLLPRGEDQFAFTHLSFQEFFAAVFFVPQFVRPPRRAGSRVIPGAEHKDLHAYVMNRMWHETLVFLAELIFAEHPDWLEELLFCLFGEGFIEVTTRSSVEDVKYDLGSGDDPKLSQAILLARLAVDPHTGLAERGFRSDAIAHCCAFEAGEQKRNEAKILEEIKLSEVGKKSEILVALLGADREELPQIWSTFANALRACGSVTLSLSETPMDSMAPLINIPGLQVLDLFQTRVIDLSPASSLVALEVLDLRQTQVSDLEPLATLTGLQSLYLSVTPVSDFGPLAALTGLKVLDLAHTHVSDLGPLASLTGLQSLDLARTPVSDLGPLAALTSLQSLDLARTPVSDLGSLAALTGLQSLDLADTPVSDLGPLAALTGLQSLNLAKTQVSDLCPLAALNGLQTLRLMRTKVSEKSIYELRRVLPKCIIQFSKAIE